MKAVNYISILVILVLGSCSSGLYSGLEYDDLYYLPSDRPVSRVQSPVTNQIVESDLRADDYYYDNIYSADTLVSNEYSDVVGNEEAVMNDYYGSRDYGYYDNYSYSGRLRRFHGNYFYPYWRDPFYYNYSWGFPSMSFGYGYPYYSDPFFYDPYYYDYGYYGGYYPRNYYGSYYGGFYNPYFSNWGYYSNASYNRDSKNNADYGRREMQSVYSTRWNSNLPSAASSRRGDSYLSKGTTTDAARRSSGVTTPVTTDSRRAVSTASGNRQMLNAADSRTGEDLTKSANTPSNRSSTTRTTTVTRPAYNSVNRSYTPSYNNPRMSTRPSYNNSRVSTERSSGSSYSGTNRSTSNTSSSVSAGQSRSSNNSSSSKSSYSVPARRSSSSGSYSSSGSRSSSSGSYSSRSSSSGSGGSYSSGSSSSSSSSGSRSSSSSSGGRR